MPKLTKPRVDSFEIRAKAYFEWDSEIKGFGVRIMPSGTKTYQVQLSWPPKTVPVFECHRRDD